MLLGAGIPLLDAIDTIARQYHGSFRASLALLRDRVAAGASLADAMREQPALFDEMSVNVIEVGEHAGSLEDVLGQAGRNSRSGRCDSGTACRRRWPTRASSWSWRSAVAVGLMTFVIPKLLDGLVESGRALPLATRVVKAASDLLVYRWWVLLIVAVGGRPGRGRRGPADAGGPAARGTGCNCGCRSSAPMIRKQAIARVGRRHRDDDEERDRRS